MSVLHLNQSEFNEKVPAAPIAMVDFWATWCGPCKMLAPVIEQLGSEYEGKAIIAKVDVDENQGLAGTYGVMSIPTVIFFKDGKEIDRKVGVMPASAYKQVLDAHI
ncbi:MAG: thioredoxin [Clostridia bacterium]|nr:thioredoxin [Clostridia bacterium]